MNIVFFLLIGLVAGWLAGQIMKGIWATWYRFLRYYWCSHCSFGGCTYFTLDHRTYQKEVNLILGTF